MCGSSSSAWTPWMMALAALAAAAGFFGRRKSRSLSRSRIAAGAKITRGRPGPEARYPFPSFPATFPLRQRAREGH
ncbi:LPXTG cell wall anchor domain-containing protein [Halomonas stenophila]|uniref:LPXTG cell wall anchor domain-containing protein n=1 Tax=Halomonas stenophila TaxID=795312 RepID=UPI003CCD08C4